MTEVRLTSKNSSGLFSTKSHLPGETILSELPILLTTSYDEKYGQRLQSQFDRDISKSPPPSKYGSSQAGNWKGMMGAAAAFAISTDEIRGQVLSLYCPDIVSPSKEEADVVEFAKDALQFCEKISRPESELRGFLQSKDGNEKVLRAMLIWACNAFEGGRIYGQMSRVNHSCDPNCFYHPPASSSSTSGEDSHELILTALAPIPPETELTVSYLGIFTWSGKPARQSKLRETKYFTCQCQRCGQGTDRASALPCTECHTRLPNNFLEEDVRWDDDDSVHYAYLQNNSTGTMEFQCEHCSHTTKDMKWYDKVTQKITNRLSSSSSSSLSLSTQEQVSADYELDQDLFHLCSSLLGARHWSTNLMLLSILQRDLSSHHSQMILGAGPPPMEDMAESIDSLQRLWKFCQHLKLDGGILPEFLLHGQTIGVARCLVALGDETSMKYGAEWVNKVRNYVGSFEKDEDMMKVVDALSMAWKKEGGNSCMVIPEEQQEGSSKRMKM